MRRDAVEPSSYQGAQHPTRSAPPCSPLALGAARHGRPTARPRVAAAAGLGSGVAVSLSSVQQHRCAPHFPWTERGPCPGSRTTEADGRRSLRRELVISSNPLRDIW